MMQQFFIFQHLFILPHLRLKMDAACRWNHHHHENRRKKYIYVKFQKYLDLRRQTFDVEERRYIWILQKSYAEIYIYVKFQIYCLLLCVKHLTRRRMEIYLNFFYKKLCVKYDGGMYLSDPFFSRMWCRGGTHFLTMLLLSYVDILC